MSGYFWTVLLVAQLCVHTEQACFSFLAHTEDTQRAIHVWSVEQMLVSWE